MAVFSVFNYDTRRYDYYQSPKTHSDLGFVFARFNEPKGKSSPIGSLPEHVSTPLPPGVFKTGSGLSPRGVIASTGTSSNGGRSSSADFSDGALGIFSPETRKDLSLFSALAISGVLLYAGYKIRKYF